jgi:hypothetical protein
LVLEKKNGKAKGGVDGRHCGKTMEQEKVVKEVAGNGKQI